MKKLILFLFSTFLLFNMVGIAGAEIITRNVSGTLLSISGDNLTDLETNTMYELFSITYDDEGTEMHVSDDYGNVYHTWSLSDFSGYEFLDDPEYIFSSKIISVFNKYVEYDRIDFYRDLIFANSNTTSFGSYRDLYEMYGNYDNNTLAGSLTLNIFGTNGSVSFQFSGQPFASEPLNPVPEPATMLLLGSGLIGLAGFRKHF